MSNNNGKAESEDDFGGNLHCLLMNKRTGLF